VGQAAGAPTTADDTRRAATAIVDAGVHLLLFAGGDGTARDVCLAVGERVPALGIPAGVKIHSAVFATNPRGAGQLAAMFLGGQVQRLRQGEVMDIDEDAFRQGRVSAELYGYLSVPVDERRVQSMKAGGGPSEAGALEGIAYRLIDEMQPDHLYIIGPGTSTQSVKERLGGGTLLGVDVVRDRQVVARDVGERELLERLAAAPRPAASIIVTIIGGQGHIFGRGNQQISPRVIDRVGRANIRVMATRQKIATLEGRPLLVDTGDPAMDASLGGYVRVAVGYNDDVVMRIASPA
jgi:predicted polyphosphate/ATP-dependent NAD kinase